MYCGIFKTADLSQTSTHQRIESRSHTLKKTGTSECHELRFVFSWLEANIFPTNMVKTSGPEAAHAQTKYQDSSVPGRGARAPYQRMSPHISAR